MSRNIAQVMQAAASNRPQEHVVVLKGGLNTTGSTVDITDGEAIVMSNYEVNVNGNYQSIAGIERFDGRPAPSDVEVDRTQFDTDEEELEAFLAEQQARRDVIQPVPGSGPVRGVYFFRGEAIAFRDTEDGTESKMYRSSEDGWQVVETPTLAPGGIFEFTEIHYAGRRRELIGVDGKNHGFLWDGETFTQIINPGMNETDEDMPMHVASLPAEILVFSYEGGSLQWSALGNPENWDVAEGAGEIALADDITGISVQANDVVAVFCVSRTFLIRGRVPAEWRVDSLYSDSGAVAGSIQAVGDSIYLDARGLTRLSRVEQFGDFNSQSLSARVHSLIQSAIPQVQCSVTINRKSQYRIFLRTGAGIMATMLGDEVAFSQFNYGTDRQMRCAISVRTPDNQERAFAGCVDGFVYELDRGTSIDGEPIQTFLRTAYSPFGGPDGQMLGIRKRLNRLVMDVRASTAVTINFSPSVDYETLDVPAGLTDSQTVVGRGAFWDGGGAYEETYWSTTTAYTADFQLTGYAETVSAYISSASTTAAPHIISSIAYRFIILDRRR